MTDERPVVLLVLASLAAEGTPRMALALCCDWLAQGIRPIVVVLDRTPVDLAPEFDAIGVECVAANMGKSGVGRYAVLAFSIFLLTLRYRARALLSMPLGWHTFMGLGARLGGARRVVAHVGNYPNAGSNRSFAKFRMLVQMGRPLTDQLVCCSCYVQRGAVEHFGVTERETIVIYNGVQREDFAVTETAPHRPLARPFTVGMVARLEKHKDHVTLIHAAKILSERKRNVVFNIVGDGSQREILQSRIDTLGLADTVALCGMRRDIPAVLADLDLFAFSTTPDEGFGIALVEAMFAGIPIVATDVGACREVLDDGRRGLLVAACDPLALADAIENIMDAPVEAKTRAAYARSEACRMFSASAMARAYGKILGLPVADEREPEACRTEILA